MYIFYFKRIIDFVLSLIGLIVLIPIFTTVFILLFINNNGSAFFTQIRPGKNGELFKILKFKTMNDKTDGGGNLLSDAKRLTKLGAFIRKTSLDEIPQLMNVLKGDMSLIGPRPLLQQYMPLYSQEQARRHNLRPGITGWAQVNGRNAISWNEKLALDVWYVDHINFKLGVRIFIATIGKVLKSEGVNKKGNSSTDAFKGNN